MEDKSGTTRNLHDYLLGLLPEAERDALESRLFEEDDLVNQLAQAETELIDDYVCHRLSAADRASVEKNYLTGSSRRAYRLAFAEALKFAQHEVRVPSSAVVSISAGAGGTRSGLWDAVRSLFGADGNLRLAVAVCCSVILIASIWIWRVSVLGTSTTTSPVSQELANQTRPVPAPVPPVPSKAAEPELLAKAIPRDAEFILRPGLDRSSQAPQIRLPAGSRQVSFTLFVDAALTRAPVATLETLDGALVLRRATVLRSARSVVFSLPASRLTQGDYLLQLTDSNSSPVSEYVFTVR